MQEFFQKAEENILQAWRDSPVDAVDKREGLFVIYGILKNFKAHFHKYLVDGQFAEKELEKMIREANA
jgi:hypothetical protein